MSQTGFSGLSQVTGVTSSTATLSWAHVPEAVVYFVYDVTSGTPVMAGHVDAPASQYELTGLSLGTTYRFRVRAVDSSSLFDFNTSDLEFTTAAVADGLLETVSGGTAAYSLRKLRTTYAGAAIRVRRDSDNAEADIGFDGSGNLDEAALSSHLGGANGFVTIWYDQVGTQHASQSTPSLQPMITTGATPSGKAAIRFDGTDDYLNNGSATYTARTVFAVWRMDSSLQPTSDLAQLWGSYGGKAHVAPDARAVGTISFDGQSPSTTTGRHGFAGAAWSGFASNPAGTGWTMDAWQQLATEFNSDVLITQHTFGSLYPDFAVGEHQFGGQLSEVVVFGSALSDPDRAKVDSSQSDYF